MIYKFIVSIESFDNNLKLFELYKHIIHFHDIIFKLHFSEVRL